MVEIGCDLPAPVDLLELITWLHIALAGEYAVKVLLVFLAERSQQCVLKLTVRLRRIQQRHGLIRQHLTLIQKRPKLLGIGDLGRQKADIRVESQVDQAGQRDGAGAVYLLYLEQAGHSHLVIFAELGQPLGQKIQLI